MYVAIIIALGHAQFTIFVLLFHNIRKLCSTYIHTNDLLGNTNFIVSQHVFTIFCVYHDTYNYNYYKYEMLYEKYFRYISLMICTSLYQSIKKFFKLVKFTSLVCND